MIQRRSDRRDAAIAAGLGLIVVVSRLPFVGRVLYHWDSINFALGLRHFDVAAGQPHVPGYILYVLLGRAVVLFGLDAQHALAAISVASGGVAVALLYLLGAFMFSRAAGLVAAVLLATSPLFWFYNEIALPHSLDLAAILACIVLLDRIRTGLTNSAVAAAIALGIAGGLRPQTQVFLAPVAVYAAWRLDWRARCVGVAVLAAIDLAWFVPLVQSVGGMSRYFEITSAFQERFTTTTSLFRAGGIWGLRRNLLKLTMYTAYAVGFGGLPLVVGLAHVRVRSWRWDPRFIVLALWSLPSLVYYLVVHMGQQGLVFVFLPAILLAIGALGAAVPRRRWQALVGAAAIANAAVFLAAPTYPLGGDRPKLLTAKTLREHDAFWLERRDTMERRFNPGHTVILSSMWRFVEYYLPAFPVVHFALGSRWEVGEGQPTATSQASEAALPAGVSPDESGEISLVVFEDDLLPFNRSPDRIERLPLMNGGDLPYMRLRADDRLMFGEGSFGVASDAP